MKLHQWNAWHPIISADDSIIWAWPWKRVEVWWAFPDWADRILVNGIPYPIEEPPPVMYYKTKPE